MVLALLALAATGCMPVGKPDDPFSYKIRLKRAPWLKTGLQLELLDGCDCGNWVPKGTQVVQPGQREVAWEGAVMKEYWEEISWGSRVKTCKFRVRDIGNDRIFGPYDGPKLASIDLLINQYLEIQRQPSPPRAHLFLRGRNRNLAFYGFRNATKEEIQELFDWAQGDAVISSKALPEQSPSVDQVVQAQEIERFDPEIILEIFRLLVEKGHDIEDLLEDPTLGLHLRDFLAMLANYLRVEEISISIGFSFFGISFSLAFPFQGAADPLMKGLDPREAAKLYLSWVIGFLRNNPRAYEAWLKLLQQAGTVIGSDEDRREFQVALTLILGRQIGYLMATDLLDEHLVEFVESLAWIFASGEKFSSDQWGTIRTDINYFLKQLASIPYRDIDKYIEHLANWAAGLIVYGEMLQQLANGTITGVYGSWDLTWDRLMHNAYVTYHPGPLLVMEIQQMRGLVGVEGYLKADEVGKIVRGFQEVYPIPGSKGLWGPHDFIGFIALLADSGAGQKLATELDICFDMPIWIFVCEGDQCRVYYANMSKEEAEQLACSARPSWCSNGHPSGGSCCVDCAEDSCSRSTASSNSNSNTSSGGGGGSSPAWIGAVNTHTYATGITPGGG
ncbi:MAG: hypothetical protein ACUVQU_07725 [Candidatus Bipolaricaulia bacterium]